MSIAQNIETIKQKIKQYALQYNKNPASITLVAVSKFHSVQSIEEAYACGLRDFGENYIQEWQTKCTQLTHLPDIRWHLIGNLQKNKVKFLNTKVHCLQSLNSLSLAAEIEKKTQHNHILPVLIQLQMDSADTNKSGISLQNAPALCEFVSKSNHLKFVGFMGIGPDTKNTSHLKDLYFKFKENCYELWRTYAHNKNCEPVISLGMSQDLEIAIECGSTMVRVGTGIFGKRI